MSAENGARQLVAPALGALPRMVLPSGLVCHTLGDDGSPPRGESVRYSLIVLLGLQRARDAGLAATLDAEAMRDAVDQALDRPEVTPGDLALRLWLAARDGDEGAPALVRALGESLERRGGLAAREGLELAWIVTALAPFAGTVDGAAGMFRAALDQLVECNRGEHGLFRHFGAPGWRRRFPNFATQIYSVLALAAASRHSVDGRIVPAARAAADRLLELQLPDGGWPWLFDADRGTVVERYEVYSVHQHGMAPMALHELSDVTGDDRYAAAAARGVAWLFEDNELGANMVPLESGMTYRSIRRRRPLDRLWLGANTAAAFAGRAKARRGRILEVNRTCRPYELGWLIEAWAGRDDVNGRSGARAGGAGSGAPRA